jgi:hypothetical protein
MGLHILLALPVIVVPFRRSIESLEATVVAMWKLRSANVALLSTSNSLQVLSARLLNEKDEQCVIPIHSLIFCNTLPMFEWNIDDDSVASFKEQSDGTPAAAASASLLSASEIEHSTTDLMLRSQRPSFLGKLLRTAAILLLCSFIAALLPQIQVAFGLLGSTVSTCTAHAIPGALCLKMAAAASNNADGAWCVT